MKLSSTVILYNPDEMVVRNILSYSSHLPHTFVLDNSEGSNPHLANKLAKFPNITYIQYTSNQGIALRLNQAAEMARENGYTHLLTMDQDSSFKEGEFANYVKKAEKYLNSHSQVAVFAVNFQPKFTPIISEPQEVLSTITSGSIIDLTIHKEIGGYDHALFLDLVDADYCYRANLAGYKTVLFSDIILNHTIGYHIWGRSLKNFKLSLRKIHPPVRIYYLVRNSLFLLNKRALPLGAKQEIKKSLWLLKNNLIYNKRWQVVKSIIRAYKDYKKGKMGKYDDAIS